MSSILFLLPWPITLLIITCVITALIIAIRRNIQKRVKPETLRSSHDVSGATYALIGLIYGIVLGLITVQGQERWLALRDAAEREAAIVISLGHMARSLSPESGRSIHNSLVEYANSIVRYEWDDENCNAQETSTAIRKVLNSISQMELSKDKNLLVSQSLLQMSSELIEARIHRQILIKEHIGLVFWCILIGGGLLLTAFLLLFSPSNSVLHIALISSVTATITAVLMLVFAYEHPTDGPMRITPDVYMNAAKIVQNESYEL